MLIFATSLTEILALFFSKNNQKMQKYIKVTEKDKSSFIALVSCEQFYKKRGAKIEVPAKEEIEKCFPEEALKTAQKSTVKADDSEALNAEKAAHDATKQKLEAEIIAHNETRQKLEAANALLQIKNEELEKATAGMDVPKKKTKKEIEE